MGSSLGFGSYAYDCPAPLSINNLTFLIKSCIMSPVTFWRKNHEVQCSLCIEPNSDHKRRATVSKSRCCCTGFRCSVPRTTCSCCCFLAGEQNERRALHYYATALALTYTDSVDLIWRGLYRPLFFLSCCEQEVVWGIRAIHTRFPFASAPDGLRRPHT